MLEDIGFFAILMVGILGIFGILGYAIYSGNERISKQQEIRYMIVKDSLDRLETCQ